MVKGNAGKYNIIAVIHARGGSRRIPHKNILPLGGEPLVSYIIKAALGNRYLRRVIVSTDHPEIKKASLRYGAEVPFVRPKKLAADCPSELVTQHATRFVEKKERKKIDIVVTLQPTTPFCSSVDIDKCIEILLANPKFNSVFSAKIVQERPEWMFIQQGRFGAGLFLPGRMKGSRGVVQSLPKLIMPNGAVYATRRDTLFKEGSLISRRTGAYLMPLEKSTDIDEPIDFLFAEFLLKKGVSNV